MMLNTGSITKNDNNNDNDNMKVVKRDGRIEEISFDKILNRVKKLGKEAILSLNYTNLVIKIIDQLYDGINTTNIDILTAEHCATLSSSHYDYGILASRILISNHHKNTLPSFYETMEKLYNHTDIHGNHNPLITTEMWDNISTNRTIYDEIIDHNRDYLFDYFGFKTLERSYLMKVGTKIWERPQHMWLRVSIAIHLNNVEKAIETYFLLSNKYFTHATPTLFNAGSYNANLSSCFLLAMEDDSLEGIFNTLKDCAFISKHAGGIGLHIHNIRSRGSKIRSTNGSSNGVVPMLRVFNNTARYVDQGGGKRPGSFAIYLEPWHADIEGFLSMKTNQGDEETKARDLFYAVWVSDLFMRRVEKNEKWTLMCPDKCQGLSDVYGEYFDTLYEKYENSGMGVKTINARDLWFKILDAQMETGTPYILYKDACNKKSNQKNLGTIKSSNLCCEVVQYSDKNETAVCNLASIALPTFVNKETKTFDYELLHKVTKVITQNLNNIIDINFYPTEKTKNSNLRHRPIGIGVQGLADVFFMMDLPFESDAAKTINKNIFETMYHAALEKSNELAIEFGSYSSFQGSPASSGILQFDMWGKPSLNERYDWDDLKRKIMDVGGGLRNSLLLAPMPTASTSQILGFNECFEPITSNIYSRGTSAGEFIIVNKYLMKELIDLGHWSEKIKNNIVANGGSIQQLTFLPQHLLDKYKIVWEMQMKNVIDMAADRGAFICQSQSMNLWVQDPNYKNLTSMHFYSWKSGLKTGIYYLRRKAKATAQQFTIEPTINTENNNNNDTNICEMCSS
jgi:ribonucleoside-diphosphate reductase alpha subunit